MAWLSGPSLCTQLLQHRRALMGRKPRQLLHLSVERGEIAAVFCEQCLKRRHVLVIHADRGDAGVVEAVVEPAVVAVIPAPARLERGVLAPQLGERLTLEHALLVVGT